jgi:hypothetical protein
MPRKEGFYGEVGRLFDVLPSSAKAENIGIREES